MNAECGAASHLWRAEDPLNLPQRDLVALMILNLVLKIFPFLLLLVLLLSTSPPHLLLVSPQELNPSNQHHMSWKAAGKLWNLLLPL